MAKPRPGFNKRVAKRGKRGYTPKLRVPRGMSNYAFGDYKICKLRYAEMIGIVGTTGAVGNQIFTMNGLFDPNITGLGHQPYCFDQLCPTIYKVYAVTGAKIECWASTSSGVNTKLTIRASSTSTPPGNLELEEERQNSRVMYLGREGEPQYQSLYISTAKLFGRSRAAITSEDDFRGSSAANPTQLGYFHIAAQSVDKSSTCGAQCNFRITYYCKFQNRNLVASS